MKLVKDFNKIFDFVLFDKAKIKDKLKMSKHNSRNEPKITFPKVKDTPHELSSKPSQFVKATRSANRSDLHDENKGIIFVIRLLLDIEPFLMQNATLNVIDAKQK